MNKKNLTEAEIRSQYIRPAIVAAGWQGADVHIREEYFTDGRMHIEGRKPLRGQRSNATRLFQDPQFDGEPIQVEEPKKMAKMLKVRPFYQYGSPKQIVDAFGGRDGFITAVRELNRRIYTVM